VIEKHLLTGSGWRIGWIPGSNSFQGLIGGDHWAIELTANELRDFCKLCIQLDDAIAGMSTELSDQESLECSSQVGNLTMDISGFPNYFKIYFCCTCERSLRKFEGSWAADLSSDFFDAVRQISALAFAV
jgi:Domain of unknown function (DUF1818)